MRRRRLSTRGQAICDQQTKAVFALDQSTEFDAGCECGHDRGLIDTEERNDIDDRATGWTFAIDTFAIDTFAIDTFAIDTVMIDIATRRRGFVEETLFDSPLACLDAPGNRHRSF